MDRYNLFSKLTTGTDKKSNIILTWMTYMIVICSCFHRWKKSLSELLDCIYYSKNKYCSNNKKLHIFSNKMG